MGRGGIRGINKIRTTTRILRKSIPIGGGIILVSVMTRIFIISTIRARGEVGIKAFMAAQPLEPMVRRGAAREPLVLAAIPREPPVRRFVPPGLLVLAAMPLGPSVRRYALLEALVRRDAALAVPVRRFALLEPLVLRFALLVVLVLAAIPLGPPVLRFAPLGALVRRGAALLVPVRRFAPPGLLVRQLVLLVLLVLRFVPMGLLVLRRAPQEPLTLAGKNRQKLLRPRKNRNSSNSPTDASSQIAPPGRSGNSLLRMPKFSWLDLSTQCCSLKRQRFAKIFFSVILRERSNRSISKYGMLRLARHDKRTFCTLTEPYCL